MTNKIKITIENLLTLEERAINIYHHSTQSTHMINHNSSITLPLQSTLKNDYIYISIVTGPGDLELETTVHLPPWLNFEFLTDSPISVSHYEKHTTLNIPPGLPAWQLKLTHSPSLPNHSTASIIITDHPATQSAFGDQGALL